MHAKLPDPSDIHEFRPTVEPAAAMSGTDLCLAIHWFDPCGDPRVLDALNDERRRRLLVVGVNGEACRAVGVSGCELVQTMASIAPDLHRRAVRLPAGVDEVAVVEAFVRVMRSQERLQESIGDETHVMCHDGVVRTREADARDEIATEIADAHNALELVEFRHRTEQAALRAAAAAHARTAGRRQVAHATTFRCTGTRSRSSRRAVQVARVATRKASTGDPDAAEPPGTRAQLTIGGAL